MTINIYTIRLARQSFMDPSIFMFDRSVAVATVLR